MPADGPIAMMAGDLMTAALGEVDWYEIAESQIEGILTPVS